MNTQRRDNRPAVANWMYRLCSWLRRKPAESIARGQVEGIKPFDARYFEAQSGVPTTPPVSPECAVTNSLLSDYHFEQLVRQDCPPGSLQGSVSDVVSGTRVTPRSSFYHVPSVPALIHATLPQAPAGFRRRAERYDGKRDLYFIHAA